MIRAFARCRLPVAAGFAALALAASFAACFAPARAADLAEGAAAQDGVPCSIGQPFWVPSQATAQELAETQGWPSVYYGHFSGGRPYVDAYGRTLVDWRDEHVCFQTSAQCSAWVSASHGAFHDPEGHRGCLLLR